MTEVSETATTFSKVKEFAKPICGDHNAISGPYYYSAEPSVLLID